MGAWIETGRIQRKVPVTIVAPHVGAWIETVSVTSAQHIEASRPTWARGLKHESGKVRKVQSVAPHVGAWIETLLAATALPP